MNKPRFISCARKGAAAILAFIFLAAVLTSCRTQRLVVRSRTEDPSGPTASEDVTPTPGTTTPDVSTPTHTPATPTPVTPTPVTPTPVTPTPVTPTPVYPQPTVFKARQYFIYDLDDDRMLVVSEGEQKVYPASITKLLTILYAKTLVSLDAKFKPGNEQELLGENSSVASISSSHALSAEILIEGMMLPSGNDAAYSLAAGCGKVLNPGAADGKEAVAAFVAGMNDYAASIGLTGSVFRSPDGYDDPEHFSTLEDMARLGALAYKDETVRKYAATVSDDVEFYAGRVKHWDNKNLCINPQSSFYVPEVTGLKTGTVGSANSCILSTATIDGRSFLVGFFGETALYDRFTDTKAAVQWIKDTIL